MTTQPWIAFIVVFAFISLLGGLMLLPPVGDAQLLNTFFGILAAGFTQVVSFYFGSSSGSAKKDETISQLSVEKGDGAKDSADAKVSAKDSADSAKDSASSARSSANSAIRSAGP